MKKLFIAICSLMILDFILTYMAIRNGFAYEINAVMAWTLDCPFVVGLLIRLAFMAVLLIPFYFWARKRENYKKLVRLACVIEGGICSVHLAWIIPVIGIYFKR